MKIGEYEIVRKLGAGGMSEIYEVENPRLGSRHALKAYSYPKEDAMVRERFLVEGRLLARLSHPRIVRVTDIGEDPVTARPYFVMDLVLNPEGKPQTLADAIATDEDTVARWYDDIRDALAYIHAQGVVHRDLKLQNVMIGPDGRAVLTDFGISRVFDPLGDGKTVIDAVQTLVQVTKGSAPVMGSLGYMAPELEMGAQATPKSDWYALGVIVYKLLTGTWCDSRTDVVGELETYDPVWRRIIPKLLHANPEGRECLSFAEEKAKDREAEAARAEARWLREKARGHFARHVARYLAALVAMLLPLTGYLGVKFHRAQAQLAVPRFEDFFIIPSFAGSSLDDYKNAMCDAWLITGSSFKEMSHMAQTPRILDERLGELERALDALAKSEDLESAANIELKCLDEDILRKVLRAGAARIRKRRAKE